MFRDRTFKHVIPYRRWSTLEQGNEDRSSDDRQIASTHAYAREMGWTITHFDAVDAGKSAFNGSNLTTGYLGKLTTRLLTGALDPRETVIIVEELDRLSRQPPGRMTAWMQPLLALGVHFAVSNTRQIINEATMNDFGQFVSLMSQGFSGYEFSRKQQERGNGSWAKRRKAYIEEGKALSRHRGRKWLQYDEAAKKWEPIPERVELIHEMFRLRLAGWGKASIAKLFNERAVAGDDRYAVWVSTKKKQPERWTVSAIARIVQDPAVTGYIKFHLSPRGAEKRTPITDLVKVYPEVIDQETFAKANERRLVEQLKSQGRGRSVSNLFGPLARCNCCGGQMTPLGSSRYRVNKDGSRSQHYFLYCQTNKMTKGADCSHSRGWTYSKVEAPILDALLTRAMDDQFFRTDDALVAMLEGKVAMTRRTLANQETAQRRILAMITDDADASNEPDAILREQYEERRAKVKETKEVLAKVEAELAEARGATTQGDHLVRVSEVRAKMDSDDVEERYQARSTVKAALASIIAKVEFDPVKGRVAAHLVGDLGLLIIRENDAAFFDLYHRQRKPPVGTTPEETAAIEGYVKRVA